MTSKEALEEYKKIEIHLNKRMEKGSILKFTLEGMEYEIIKRDLEVLEIIKSKKVNIQAMSYVFTLEEYNKNCCSNYYHRLTEDEYNKIKEWLDGR